MRNDSADGRTVEAHSEAFSGGAYSRWASRTQADPDPSCAGRGTVDTQHRCAMAHAAAKLSELQNCSSALSNLVLQRDFASSFDGCCQRASRQRRAGRRRMLHRCDVRYGQRWRIGNRTNEARKRHENHGDCGSPWGAAFGSARTQRALANKLARVAWTVLAQRRNYETRVVTVAA